MKSISSSIVVLCGTAMLIAAANSATTWSRDALASVGFIVCIVGIIGWAYSLRAEK